MCAGVMHLCDGCVCHIHCKSRGVYAAAAAAAAAIIIAAAAAGSDGPMMADG